MFFLSSPCSCVCYWMQPNRRSLQQPWGVSVSLCWADCYVHPEICILLGMSLRVPQFIVDENGGLETKLAIGILESRLCWPASCKICSWKYVTEYQLVNAPSTAATQVGQVLGVTSAFLPQVAVSDLVQYRSLVQSCTQIKWEGGAISLILHPDQVRGRGLGTDSDIIYYTPHNTN